MATDQDDTLELVSKVSKEISLVSVVCTSTLARSEINTVVSAQSIIQQVLVCNQNLGFEFLVIP